MRPPTTLAPAGLLQPGNLVLPLPPESLGPATPRRLPLQCLAWPWERAAAYRHFFSSVGESTVFSDKARRTLCSIR